MAVTIHYSDASTDPRSTGTACHLHQFRLHLKSHPVTALRATPLAVRRTAPPATNSPLWLASATEPNFTEFSTQEFCKFFAPTLSPMAGRSPPQLASLVSLRHRAQFHGIFDPGILQIFRTNTFTYGRKTPGRLPNKTLMGVGGVPKPAAASRKETASQTIAAIVVPSIVALHCLRIHSARVIPESIAACLHSACSPNDCGD